MLLCQERPPFQLNNHRAEALQILMLHKQEIVVANINVQFSCSYWEKKNKVLELYFYRSTQLEIQ